MKKIFALFILSCIIAMPALGELTDADLDKIRVIVNDAEARIKERVLKRKSTKISQHPKPA